MDLERVKKHFHDIDDYYLYKAINISPNDYTDEVLALAKQEYQQRNVTNEKEEGFRARIKKNEEEKYIKENTPLSWFQRIICFVFSTTFGLIIGIYHWLKGNRRKKEQAWMAIILGVMVKLSLLSIMSFLYRVFGIDLFRHFDITSLFKI